MADAVRTHDAGSLRVDDVGTRVTLAGWVNARRDHGGVYFLDLRDASGVAQVVVNPEDHAEAGETAHRLRDEFCISVSGEVRHRPEGTVNPELPTGEVEVAVDRVDVLSPSDPLPFQVDDRADVDEFRRLEFRYLDMRRPKVAANLRARSEAIRAMRRALDEREFLEVETPTLIRSTPEGARDVLVPSRLRQGSFYALPQSPQLFKQLLMIGGVERYYQIARCYRDEDFRADRQLEFTQLDVEGAFWGQEDVLDTIEEAVAATVAELRHLDLDRPFARMTYAEAMARYGTDKPDVRFGMELVDLGGVFAETGFKAFAGVLESGGLVAGIDAGDLGLSRSGLDGLVSRAQELGAKGLVWMVVEDDGSLRSPVAKFLSDDEQAALVEAFGATAGDTLLIVADAAPLARRVLGELRLELGRPEGHDELAFLWVVDFPVFEVGPDGQLFPAHHPFTAPVDVDEMASSPETAVSKAYDLVLNGSELGSGSVRIHDPGTQQRVFEILGIGAEEAESRFGWFLRALRYGTPPHAGFAVGIDRLVSILRDEPNIREVIPFPKTQSGLDPMTRSPALVADEQLRELGIDLRPEVRERLDEEGASAPEHTELGIGDAELDADE
ncbi:MAG: aspartate--tRNA ligase [Acidimicrobiia bacterium]|nr:aspartate--tRNA ligase [Acidimicrobiia bacterium]